MDSALERLKQFVACPSVSTDPAYEDGMLQARGFLKKTFSEIGLLVEEVPTNRHAVILAKKEGDLKWPHIVIYGHYDVQPPDPLELWQTPPFEPVVKEGKLYGRGAADNKGPLFTHIMAVAALLKENPGLPLRLTFFVEGEEEIGSPSFEAFLETHKEELKGDFLLLSDTMSPSAKQWGITTGLRGVFHFEITLIGPRMDLHSGLHGGVVRNPIEALAKLLATLHTEDGRVNVPGFYDEVLPPTDWERSQIKQLPGGDDYQSFLGVPEFFTPPGYTPFEASRFLPTLEINGITGGYQGQGSKTVIPSVASAKISVRLVEKQTVQATYEKIVKVLKERLPSGVMMELTAAHGGAPYRVYPPAHPLNQRENPFLNYAFQALDEAIVKEVGRSPLYIPEGGSIPIIQRIKEVIGLDAIMLGLFLPDSHLHAPNENFDLELFEKGQAVIKEALRTIARGAL